MTTILAMLSLFTVRIVIPLLVVLSIGEGIKAPYRKTLARSPGEIL